MSTHPNRVLVLDSTYRPIGTAHWQKAIALYWLGRVDVIEEYDAIVRSPSIEMKVPAVIKLVDYIHKYKPRIRFSRRNVYIRDNSKCQYCQKLTSYEVSTLDHVIPRAQGGITCWENIVIACPECNEVKADRTPREAGMRIVNPQRPSFNLLFRMTLGLLKVVPPEWDSYLVGIRKRDERN